MIDALHAIGETLAGQLPDTRLVDITPSRGGYTLTFELFFPEVQETIAITPDIDMAITHLAEDHTVLQYVPHQRMNRAKTETLYQFLWNWLDGERKRYVRKGTNTN